MSKLGPLPEFGRREGRGLTSGPQLDEDALGPLLGSHRRRDSASKSHRQKKAIGTRDSEDTNFHNQLAGLTGEENEEEDVPVTVEETKQLVESVDVDDMDANLFGSFTHGQKTRGRPSKSRSSAKLPPPSTARGRKTEGSGLVPDAPLDRTEVSVWGEKTPRQPMAHTGGRKKELKGLSGVDLGDRHMNGGPKANMKPKVQKSDLDDDILDLLSDGDHGDVVPKTRTKPKIQLRTSRGSKASEGSSLDGKPTTSEEGVDDNGRGEEGKGRGGGQDSPKLSHWKSEVEKQEDLDGRSKSKEKGRADIWDSSSEQQRPAVSTKSAKSQSATVSSFSSSKIDFSEDGDDLLLGMGLDDSRTSTTSKDSGTRRGSKMDELLGTVARKTTGPGGQPAQSEKNKVENVKSTAESGEREEENYHFGGYLPSVALDGGSLKPRRRYSSDDALTSRPSTAPAKKSVRFADMVETSDRPSSSPAVTEPPKPSLKGTRRSASAGRTKEGGEASRRPPLPQRMNTPAGVGVSESEGPADHHEVVMHGDSSLVGDDRQSDGELLSTESYMYDESTPKHQTSVKGRGKSGSLQISSATKLFDSSRKQDEADELGGDQIASTSVDMEGSHTEEELPPRPVSADERLEHPLFPWQMNRQSHTSASKGQQDAATPVKSSATPDEGTLMGAQTSLTRGQSGSQDHSLGAAMDTSVGQSFQEQLLQQQGQVREQRMRLQSQGGEVYSSDSMPKTSERGVGGGERQRRESMQERVKEVESLLEQERAEKQRRVREVQHTLQMCEAGRGEMEEELREKAADMERGHQTLRQELTSQIDELKLKLHRVELERDQFRQSLEVERAHHTEELSTVQSANEARLKAIEESFQRREARWREETESEASRFQEHLQQAERERVDAVTALRRKVDSVEVVKANEISRLQEVHRAAVVDLKNEHELDKQHLQRLHRQEVEAMKTAHSHTRLLSELTRQVEVSSHEVSQLQQRIDHAHSRGAEEREQGARAQEEHLKVLEDRMSRQQAENEAERGRLQSLIAKLEAHVAHQSRQIEQERWQLQQEGGKLKAQQASFEEERTVSLRRTEEEKDHLQIAREKFLSEQREVLTQCYEERRELAAERAELSMLQRRALEREQKETQRNLQTKAELESSLSHLREESVRVAAEGTRVREEGEKWRWEREALERDREKLETFGRELQQRSQEIEDMCQSAVEVHDRGEKSLLEAQTLQLKLSEQSRAIETQLAELREREKHFATEQLALAHQKRELQHLVTGTRNFQVSQPSGRTTSLHCDNETLESVPSRAPETVYTPLHSAPLPPPHSHTTNCGPSSHSFPRASPVHVPLFLHPSLSSSSVKSSLAHLQRSRNMREMVLLAEKDREDLEEECKFLESLQNNTGVFLDG